VTLLLFKIQREYWETLKSFLLFLNIVRDDDLSEVEENRLVLTLLEKL
jgi:hypothetical protein